MTYADIQLAYKNKYRRTVETCWIADVKRRHNATSRIAANRISKQPAHPCPPDIYPKLEAIMKKCGMI